MINNLNILSVKILNSQYKCILNVLVTLIIYICFSGNFNKVVLCTNDNLPIIAEPKVPVIKGTAIPSVLQVEVSSFLNQAGTIIEQKQTIEEQHMQINNLLTVQEEMKEEKKGFEEAYQELLRQNRQNEIDNRMLEYELKNKDSIIKNKEDLLKIYQKSKERSDKELGEVIASCNANAKAVHDVVATSNANAKTITEANNRYNNLVKKYNELVTEKNNKISEMVKDQNDRNTQNLRNLGIGTGLGILTCVVGAYFINNHVDLRGISTAIKELLQLKK